MSISLQCYSPCLPPSVPFLLLFLIFFFFSFFLEPLPDVISDAHSSADPLSLKYALLCVHPHISLISAPPPPSTCPPLWC